MMFEAASRTHAVLLSDVLEMMRKARRLERDGHGIAYLVQGEPDFDTPSHITEAAYEAIKAGYTHYPPAEGYLELRQAVAEKLWSQNGVRYEPEGEVLITNGAALGLYLAIHAIVEPGDDVLLPDPAFGAYAMIVGSAGGVATRFPLKLEGGQRQFDRQAFLEALTPKTCAVVLCSPDNPTGHVYSETDLRFVGDVAVERGLLVITDEVYEHFIYTTAQHHSLAALDAAYREHTILVNSFSKTYAMTGWRLGYNAAPKRVMEAMTRMNAVAGRAAAAFTQRAGVTVLTGDQGSVTEMAREYGARRAIMLERLGTIPDLRYSIPDGAFYVFIDCSAWGLPSREMADRVLELGRVVVTPGDYYGPAGKGCLRLSFASSREAIEQGMEGLAKALEALREVTA